MAAARPHPLHTAAGPSMCMGFGMTPELSCPPVVVRRSGHHSGRRRRWLSRWLNGKFLPSLGGTILSLFSPDVGSRLLLVLARGRAASRHGLLLLLPAQWLADSGGVFCCCCCCPTRAVDSRQGALLLLLPEGLWTASMPCFCCCRPGACNKPAPPAAAAQGLVDSWCAMLLLLLPMGGG